VELGVFTLDALRPLKLAALETALKVLPTAILDVTGLGVLSKFDASSLAALTFVDVGVVPNLLKFDSKLCELLTLVGTCGIELTSVLL
jgi:hypothetical protein